MCEKNVCVLLKVICYLIQFTNEASSFDSKQVNWKITEYNWTLTLTSWLPIVLAKQKHPTVWSCYKCLLSVKCENVKWLTLNTKCLESMKLFKHSDLRIWTNEMWMPLRLPFDIFIIIIIWLFMFSFIWPSI